jgi:transcriptional regulator with XRE-family HTH domain
VKLAQIIRELRRSQGLSLSELARRSRGLSKGLLSNLESGAFSPSVRTLIKIADGLNIELRKLLSLTSVEILMEDPLISFTAKVLPRLTTQHRQQILKTLQAAPRSRGRR